MNERFRDTNREGRQPNELPDGSSSVLREIRRAGDAFLAAGDEAVSRTLSGDSPYYLTQQRQNGGQ
jgi:hypothetical protein